MQNVISFFGMFAFIGLAWLLSENRRHFPWRIVGWGLVLQMTFAALVLWWTPGSAIFLRLNNVFNALLDFSREGQTFVFNSIGTATSTATTLSLQDYLTRVGATSTDPVVQGAIRTGTVPGFFMVFQVLTTIIFFSALLSVFYYLGIMQKIVALFARIMAHTMKVSGAEALSNSANIFVGQTEAPLVIRPFLEKMTRSELMAIMVGGFANTAGGVLGAYILMLSGYFPNIAAHLISASILSAPAGFIIAKVMIPEREKPATLGDLTMDVPSEDTNILEAAASGSTVGWQLAINVAAMLISFVALLAMANMVVGWTSAFFYDRGGLFQLNLILLSVLGGLLMVRRLRKISDTTMWASLFGIVAAYGAARALMPGPAWTIMLMGLGAWFPLLVASIRNTVAGKSAYLTLLGVFIVANVAFMIFGPLPVDTRLSLQLIIGWIHWPIAFLMGTPVKDCLVVGRFLGEKLILTEFGAYANLAGHLEASRRGAVAALDPRSIVLVSYALSGFANFASIAIQIGGIAPLAPSRKQEIARLGLRAMIGGAITSYMIACIAGVFYNGTSMLGL
jgi:concentrative nucleoside transporter, CNT family